MSDQLFEVLSLSARYLFVFLAAFIVLKTILLLLSEDRDRRARIRRLPNSGFIGELVVLSGNQDLPEGLAIPIPWEGILGSVRSCDICVPAEGINRRHLTFSFRPGQGFLIHPCSGCECQADNTLLNVRSRPESAPLRHGSRLRISGILLRVRLFAGLDPNAGFPDNDAFSPENMLPDSGYMNNPQYPAEAPGNLRTDISSGLSSPVTPPFPITPDFSSDFSGSRTPFFPVTPDISSESPQSGISSAASAPDSISAPARRRRSDRWEEADWSE